MSRPHCWVCGARLMYVKGKPVYAEITDPIGVRHMAHKYCAKQEEREADDIRRRDFNEFAREAKP